jgi:hypothetical protein
MKMGAERTLDLFLARFEVEVVTTGLADMMSHRDLLSFINLPNNFPLVLSKVSP